MALRKNVSRASDRVKIRKWHAAGVSIKEIENALSITPEHIQYVIDTPEAVLPKPGQKAPQIDMEAERERIRAEVMAELDAQKEDTVETEAPDETASETQEETVSGEGANDAPKPKPTRRRKAKVKVEDPAGAAA